MNKKNILSIQIILFFISTFLYASDTNINNKIQYSLSFDKQEYVLNEPINIEFDISINDAKDTYVFFISDIKEFSWQFSINEDNNVEILNPYHIITSMGRIRYLKPNKTHSENILLNKYLKFKKSGEYEIQCQLDLLLIKHPEISNGIVNEKIWFPIRKTLKLKIVD
ncbi:hypothetical protein KA977_05440 [Candidatus Dependentiae bacterium]|nr:hypothetical protein [Candidatus Dependentiae bacterium]